MNPNIRETKETDFEAILKIFLTTELVGEWFTQDLFERILQRNKGLFLVAEREGIVVGSIFASHDGGYFGYIYKIAVLSQYQRQGIASALLKEVIDRFTKLSIDWYFGFVKNENLASKQLLAKFGIRQQREYQLYDNWVKGMIREGCNE